jgi:internalin A
MNDAPRQRFRFGLKSLLVAMTLAGIVLASLTYPLIEARQQQALMNRVTAMGGRVSNLSVVMRPMSPGRFVLSFFSPKFDRYYFYGFDFSGTLLTDDDLEWVAQIKHVKELDLHGTQVSDAGLRCLRNSVYLTKLDLRNTRVTDQALPDLLTMELLASLSVGGTSISYKALEELDAKLMYAHFCEEKTIVELGAAGIHVANSTRALEGDRARGCWIVYAGRVVHNVYVGMGRPTTLTAPDVENLGHLDSLPTMKFHSVNMGQTGLAGLRPLANLKDLEILYTNLSDSDLTSLAKQTQLESLKVIGCDAITDDGISHLKSLKNLKKLEIQCKRVSKKAIERLEKELPDCKINRD